MSLASVLILIPSLTIYNFYDLNEFVRLVVIIFFSIFLQI